MFIDKIKIYVKAGNGGDGAVSFRREKYVAKGGPDGGDGGRGGNVIFRCDPSSNTLLAFRYKRKFTAENGAPGAGAKFHGKNGEDGTIQGLFELARIPYVGCGVLGSAVCMDKAVANTIMDAAGVPHCKWASAIRAELEGDHKTLLDSIEQRLGYPIFVKPANAGSSVGITKATDRAVLEQAVVTALKEDDKVVFEEFIDGQEVECAAIGNPDDPATVSTTRPGEILAGAEFYTYDDKYKNGVSQTVIPARLSEEKLDEVRTEARRAYLALGCAGLSRCDFFVERGTGRVLCNELNTLPGFTSISMYPKLMEHEGLSYAQLVDRLLQLALHRRKGAY